MNLLKKMVKMKTRIARTTMMRNETVWRKENTPAWVVWVQEDLGALVVGCCPQDVMVKWMVMVMVGHHHSPPAWTWWNKFWVMVQWTAWRRSTDWKLSWRQQPNHRVHRLQCPQARAVHQPPAAATATEVLRRLSYLHGCPLLSPFTVCPPHQPSLNLMPRARLWVPETLWSPKCSSQIVLILQKTRSDVYSLYIVFVYF